ncbi:MAG TPA: SRPBCC domain-containing protein [Albitalea sp.]|nr:SRPBCC domain-containing protein [Albitalea sp.]
MSIASTKVHWPQGMEPHKCPVYARNELFIRAPRERIWELLIAAVHWPEWYSNSRDVLVHGGGETLTPDAVFDWTTFGLRLKNVRVTEYERGARLSWRASGLVEAYHSWVLEAVDGGVMVTTEETNRGWAASLLSWYIRPGLLREHQKWLEGLARKAVPSEK